MADTVVDPDGARWAARAVAGSLRPAVMNELARHRTGLFNERGDQEAAAELIVEAMLEDWNLTARVAPWWAATGPQLTAALTHVTTLNETDASHILGASLHVLLIAKQDTAPDAVLRVAERAAAWDAGRLVGEREQLTVPVS